MVKYNAYQQIGCVRLIYFNLNPAAPIGALYLIAAALVA